MSSIFKVSILLKEIGRDGAKMARFRDLRVLKKLRAILDDFSSLSHYVLIKMQESPGFFDRLIKIDV